MKEVVSWGKCDKIKLDKGGVSYETNLGYRF